ncbi:MAG: preprotein translocase subunit SecE [Candidatus Paceibacterota bacterium]|jgi:preprotein translocase subunit SecE
MSQLTNYIKDTKSEMKHVSWPTKKQTINFTTIVIGISIFMAVLLGVFDLIYQYILRFLLS